MKVLVVGRGGREHAVVKKLARDGVAEIFAAPGNAGMVGAAKLVDISEEDIAAMANFAESSGIDLTIVGPESALVAGIADEFNKRGLKIFGPEKAGAELEGSKAFAKALMRDANIPTAAYQEFTSLPEALAYLEHQSLPIVIKADGLAAGKGVIIAQTLAEAKEAVTSMLEGNQFGEAGHRVVIEDFLEGEEFSLLSFVSGQNYIPMPIARDYKRAFDNDAGPNTGGMGAHSPNPLITEADREEALTKVVEPTLAALADKGVPFTGVLYAGLIKTANGVKVIEFNVRFGDPETEAVLPLLETPLVELVTRLTDSQSPLRDPAIPVVSRRASGAPHSRDPRDIVGDNIAGWEPTGPQDDGKDDATPTPSSCAEDAAAAAAGVAGSHKAKCVANGDVTDDLGVKWADAATVGVVLASIGYPGDYPKGAHIHGLEALESEPDIDVYHMGTKAEDGQIVTNGGRVLFVVGQGKTLAEARDKSYAALEKIDCPELFHRKDIAAKF